MFCNQCGSEIKDLSQKFCESCGAEVKQTQNAQQQDMLTASPSSQATPATQASPTQPSTTLPEVRKGGLFDMRRDYYVFKEKYWDRQMDIPSAL